jgi:hypothetical protein
LPAVKRIIILIIVVLIAAAYPIYHRLKSAHRLELAQKYALVTAQVWVATAEYRKDPDRFLAYRDSLLQAHSVSSEELEKYLKQYESHPEDYDLFTRLVQIYIDSLTGADSTAVTDTVTPIPDSLKITE